MSYQVVNNSNYTLNVLIYIDNYETGCTKRIYDLKQESTTDTIYATSNPYAGSYQSHSHIFGISIFINNSEYTFKDMTWIKDFQHHIISIADSTKLIPRSAHGIEKYALLKDLYRSE